MSGNPLIDYNLFIIQHITDKQLKIVILIVKFVILSNLTVEKYKIYQLLCLTKLQFP